MATRVGIDRIANPLPSDVAVQFCHGTRRCDGPIAHRQWPLWNPFELSGNVLAAAAQSAPFHPVTLLGLLLPAPDAPGFMGAMTYSWRRWDVFSFFEIWSSGAAVALRAAGWALVNVCRRLQRTPRTATAIALLRWFHARRAAGGAGSPAHARRRCLAAHWF